jgi:hypothetical protein
MRRRRGLLLIIAVLLILAGGYTAFWFIAAGKIEQGVSEWAEQARAQKLDVSWQKLRVGGFPFAFTIGMNDAVLRDEAANPATEIRMPRLSASAHPWAFRVWHLTAPNGVGAVVGPQEKPAAKVSARTADGVVSAAAEGGATIWLSLDMPRVEATEAFGAKRADLWLIVPARMPETHHDSNIALAADLHDVMLPQAPSPFRNLLDELALGVTVKGPISPGTPRQAVTAWRDEGGSAELDNFTLRWGTLTISGSGTLALDSDLQPVGAFSGAVEGYDELMNALVAAGRMKPSDAGLARIGLAMFAKAGPSGRPAITASFTIQNGQMFLGPAKLGPTPKIPWD